MGLCGPAFDAIGREHAYRSITGDVLFIGRQTTYFTATDLIRRLGDYGHQVDSSVIEFDQRTVNRRTAGEYVTDRSIFRALGVPANRIKALDVSPYEGAEVIHDLNRPLPWRLRRTADFIVDGSTLDNVFNPAQALLNLDALLRPGGRLLLVNAWNLRDSAYTLCSAAWYFDFFVANGYADCKVYMGVFREVGGNMFWLEASAMGVCRTVPTVPSRGMRPFLVVLAEKSRRPPPRQAVPTQADYRSESDWAAYRERLATIVASPRPHVVCSIDDDRAEPPNGYLWIDRSFIAHR